MLFFFLSSARCVLKVNEPRVVLITISVQKKHTKTSKKNPRVFFLANFRFKRIHTENPGHSHSPSTHCSLIWKLWKYRKHAHFSKLQKNVLRSTTNRIKSWYLLQRMNHNDVADGLFFDSNCFVYCRDGLQSINPIINHPFVGKIVGNWCRFHFANLSLWFTVFWQTLTCSTECSFFTLIQFFCSQCLCNSSLNS